MNLPQGTRARSSDTAALLTLSRERDLWLRRLLDAERAAYRAGYRDGRTDEQRDADRAWSAQPPAPPVPTGPTFAELEARRWDPGGRGHYGDPRPGDRTPPTRLEAAS